MDVLEGSWSVPGCLRAAAVNSSLKDDSESAVSTRMESLLFVMVVLMCVGSVTECACLTTHFFREGNLLVIILVATTKTLHQVTSVLIMNLAISDLLVGLGVMPFVALSIVKPGWGECFNLCLFVAYTSSVYCTVSVLTLAAIALDRYHSIMDCLRYSSRCTLWRMCSVVVWIWLQAMATSFPPLLGWSSVAYVTHTYSCVVDWTSSPSYTATMTSLSYVVPAIVILVCYVNIVKVARNHAKRIHSLEYSVQRSRDPNAMFPPSLPSPSTMVYNQSRQCVCGHPTPSRELSSMLSSPQTLLESQQHYQRVARLFLVILAFFLCWTPYIGVALFQATEAAISGETSLVPPSALTVSYFLVLLNSDFNPLLYALLSKRFQAALRGLRQKLRAGVGSVVSWGGEVDPCSITTPLPGPNSSSNTSQCCSPVFTISSDDKLIPVKIYTKRVFMEVTTPSCSTGQGPCGGRRLNCLQVPCRTREGGTLPFSTVTVVPTVTYVCGQITVKVEHAPSEILFLT
ncbi:LOW QUALITY PROTEIN: beta-3 adrenergic receptor [Hippocampus zosterae]|uniref:LOW QUALITY PROTEIN: beta-3 adrenergic receptor n=1 Tax=Hippocampus zosterae TaxID=109293 RepID=UPI00223DF925|nr:LOW QUALITY PROTEIN: beta-3 adrenergic receptor [Hippocampus zosterae]